MNATEILSAPVRALLESVARVSESMWHKGWAEANGGNLSIDITGQMDASLPPAGDVVPLETLRPAIGGRCFLITGSGRRFRDLPRNPEQAACILRVEDNGSGWRLVWGGCGKAFRPTSELPTHLALHESLRLHRPDRNVVLHTHPTELIAISHLRAFGDEDLLNRTLLGTMPEVKVLAPRGVGLVPYNLPGSEALATATRAVFERGRDVALWEMHGCLATGADIESVFDIIDTVNKGAHITLLCLAAGQAPKGLSQAQLDELTTAFKLEA